MLKIRSEQIRTFQTDAEESFVGRVTDYILENHAEDLVKLPAAETTIAKMPAKNLRVLVKTGIEKARLCGVEWKSNLLAFVTMMIVGAPNFTDYEKARLILINEKLTAEERVEQLTKEMTDADWAAVAENYDPFKWNFLTEEKFV